jgi:hypothetical protein
MLGLPLLSWLFADNSLTPEPLVADDIRRALAAVGSPILPWLDEKEQGLEEAS